MSHVRTAEDQALIQLDRWLGYEVKSALLLGLLFLLPMGPVVWMLHALMVVFTPVMIVQLYRARWYRSLALFIVMMACGYVVPRVMTVDPLMGGILYPAAQFVPFYFFCWALKWVIRDRVSELRALEKMRAEDLLVKRRSGH